MNDWHLTVNKARGGKNYTPSCEEKIIQSLQPPAQNNWLWRFLLKILFKNLYIYSKIQDCNLLQFTLFWH